jgi:hypothetical protein
MNNVIPAMDPIPLPAPVWLFKLLHILTLALHFVTVEMLLGGLLVAAWLNFLGTRGGPLAGARLTAGAALARRLPIVMTYVINLGVPPLLFAQVLYGRALYTSSVLIGAWWIAVIFLLMGSYWLLYRFAGRAQAGQAGWMGALLAWLMAGLIAKIYSTNMTLMLRPDVWTSMYSTSAHGTLLPPHDPTLLPRWLYMLTGGLAVAGLWMVWLAANRNIADEVRSLGGGGRGGFGAAGAVGLSGATGSRAAGDEHFQPDAGGPMDVGCGIIAGIGGGALELVGAPHVPLGGHAGGSGRRGVRGGNDLGAGRHSRFQPRGQRVCHSGGGFVAAGHAHQLGGVNPVLCDIYHRAGAPGLADFRGITCQTRN